MDQAAIESAIEAAEARTAAELAVMVVPRSDDYDQAVAAGVEALIAVAGPGVAPAPEGPSAWEQRYFGRTPLWYGLMAVVSLGVMAVCFWQPLVGVVAVLVMGQIWWPAALLGGLALWLRWRFGRRPRLRDGYGAVRAGGPSRWRGYGALAGLTMLGNFLGSRSGRDVTAGLGKVIASRGFSGLGGRFGGGGASGGW